MSFGRVKEVHRSVDFTRVDGLPRRSGYPDGLTEELTRLLRTPSGTQSLRDLQAQALYELAMNRGGFFPMQVGTGKTLVTLLAGRVLKARQVVLIIPAKLVKKTEIDRQQYGKHWRITKNLIVLTKESLGKVEAVRRLELAQPDLIIVDECHFFKNQKAACTKRLMRYMDAHPETMMVALDGTVMDKSLQDFAHILAMTHKERAPIALEYQNLEQWANALDDKVNFMSRPHPGVLLEWARGDGDDLSRARQGFRARLTETPGVVASTGGSDYGGSLSVSGLRYDVNAVTQANFKKLRKTWVRPDGYTLTLAPEVWAVARQLALGLHYVWFDKERWYRTIRDLEPFMGALERVSGNERGFGQLVSLITETPVHGEPEKWLVDAVAKYRGTLQYAWKQSQAPAEWLEIRKGWGQFARDKMSIKRLQLDSEKAVALAVEAGELDDGGILAGWKKIEPEYSGNKNGKPVWHDDAALRVCEGWLEEHDGIVFIEHSFFAHELQRRTKLPYFGAGGVDDKGVEIEKFNGPKCLASLAANGTGRNLQHFSEALVSSLAGGATQLEQLLGRLHRSGQLADSVSFEFLLGCSEHGRAILTAIQTARYQVDMLGQTQKILDCDLDLDMPPSDGARWAFTDKDEY